MTTRPQPQPRSGPGRRPTRVRAFTYLEVIATLVVMGLLAAVLLPRFTGTSADQTSTVEMLKVRIRYAQLRSINNLSVHGVCSTGTTYWLFHDGDDTKKLLFPGADSNTVSLPSGITMSSFTVSFDSRGVPYSDAAASTGHELADGSPAASITVGGQAGAVRVTPGTGYVPD